MKNDHSKMNTRPSRSASIDERTTPALSSGVVVTVEDPPTGPSRQYNRDILKMSMTPASGGGDIRQKALDVQCVGIGTLS